MSPTSARVEFSRTNGQLGDVLIVIFCPNVGMSVMLINAGTECRVVNKQGESQVGVG